MMYGLDMADLKTRLEMSIWEWQLRLSSLKTKLKAEIIWDTYRAGIVDILSSILPMESSERRKRRLQERLMDVTQEDMQGVGVQRVHVLV